ncbi:MAG: hypothetical protein ABFD89_05355 [Bryobacteraceae bacterium]
MLLSKKQTCVFWHEWAACVRLHHWPTSEAETQRKAMLARAGFTSLTKVDKLTGFDHVLAEIKALSQPSDLEAQLRQQNQPRTRLVYACRKLADEAYIVALAASTRFNTSDWTALPMETLEELRITLSDRQVEKRRHGTAETRAIKARARKAAAPAPRITFPDLAIGNPAIGYPDEPEQPAANPCERCGSECNPETGECEECTERRAQSKSQEHASDLAAVSDDVPF